MQRVATRVFIAVLLMLMPAGVWSADAKLDAVLNTLKIVDDAPKVKPADTSKETGTAASEILQGNGSRAGYVLGQGSIVPGSEWVYVGVRRMKQNDDYSIDYSTGSVFFAEPVRQSESIRVDYRYLQESKGGRTVSGPGLMQFNLGGNLQITPTYVYRAADPKQGSNAPDILTYGINSTTKFGASTLSSMMFMATPQTPNRLSITSGGTPQAKKGGVTVKRDRLMVQDADLGLGKVRLKLGFQDVGEDFAGFTGMRESNSASAEVLNQLEKEKGIRRMDIATTIPMGAGGGLSFSMGQIKDKKDDILSQAFAYTSDNMKLGFMTREVGKEFSRFKDLREADRGQLAAEIGIRRTGYFLQFKTGVTAENAPVWSGLNMTTLASDRGELNYRSADLDLGKVKIQADVRTMDPTFNKMTALNDEERTRMALIARKQFDPKSQVAQVTAQDKAQMNKEAGLNRSSYTVGYEGAGVSTWLSLTDVGSGALTRTGLTLEAKGNRIYFNHHSIDSEFNRLGNMQAVEVAHFGNEYGMSRTETGGLFKLGIGQVGLSHAHVVDHQGAYVRRESLDFKNDRLKFRANFQDIDPRFSRIMDLSDTDKKLLVQERGFKRADYSIDLQAAKNLNVKSYIYGSTNVTAEQTRGQNRHQITYTPASGPQVTAFTDSFSYISETGNLSSYSRRKITFDNKFNILGGLLFKGMTDTNTTQEMDADSVTTQTTQAHLETDQKARTSYTFDFFEAGYGAGRFEDMWAVGAKTKVSERLALTGSFAKAAREEDKSEANGAFGVDWAISKDLKLSLNVANRDGGPKGSQQARQFSLNGLLAKRFLMFNDVKIGSATNTTQLKGRQVGCDNAFKMEAGIWKGNLLFDNSDKLNPKNGIYYTSRVLQYESDKDPNKWYHLTFFRQNLVTPTGEPARKRNYTADFKLSPKSGLTMTSYFGKDGQNGAVLAIGGTVYKLRYALGEKMSFITDFSTDRNDAIQRMARTAGLGIAGTLSSSAAYEVYFGWTRLIEKNTIDHDKVFRVKYDHKVSPDQYISLSAQKRSSVEKTSINPFEGNTTARIDFRTVFN